MGETPTILVVDDQVSVVNSLTRLFKRRKYHVLSANDASQAISLITDKNNQISLVISDQRMPGTTGTELADQLKNKLKLSLPVIILSGYSDMADINQAKKNNSIDLFIEKPWDNDALIAAVEKCLHHEDRVNGIDLKDRDFFAEKSIDVSSDIDPDITDYNEKWYTRLLGKLAVDHRFISQEQLDKAMKRLEASKESGRNVSIENILYENKLIDSKAMGKLMASTKRMAAKSFCYAAISRNMMTMADMEKVLDIQAHEFNETSTCRFADNILISEGFLSRHERDLIIIDQYYSEYVSDETTEDSKNEIEKKKKSLFLKERAMDTLFGRLAVEKKYVQPEEITNALSEQLTTFSTFGIIKKTGDILVAHGNLSPERNLELLGIQKRHLLKDSYAQSQEENATIEHIGYDDEFELKITQDKMTAFCKKTGESDEIYSVEEFKQFLKKSGINYGIVSDKKIEDFLLNDSIQNAHTLIAKGKEGFVGRQSYVKPLFETDYLDVGRKDAKGSIDYKERGRIPFVESGVVLAEIIPPIQGKTGVTITGEFIDVEAYEPASFVAGEGVSIDPNGHYLLSAVSGQPVLGPDTEISVRPLKLIDGDVDYRTGHVVFEGNIEVKGCVQSGFLIKAANVAVEEINGGIIEASGDVTVQNGVIGGKIRAQGNVNAGYIKDATVVAYQDIIVKSLIIDSELITGGHLIAERGKAVSSNLITRLGGTILNIGTDVSKPCKINIGTDAFMNHELERFDKAIAFYTEKRIEAQNMSAKLTKENKDLKARHNELTLAREKIDAGKKIVLKKINTSDTQARSEHEKMLQRLSKMTVESDKELEIIYKKQTKVFAAITKVNHWLTEYTEKRSTLEAEKNKFKQWSQSQSSTASLRITGTLSEDNILEGKHTRLVVKDAVRNVKIKEVSVRDQQGNVLYKIIIEPPGR